MRADLLMYELYSSCFEVDAHDWMTSPKKTRTATRTAISASSRRIGWKPRGGPEGRCPSSSAAARQPHTRRRGLRLGGRGLVLEEVELDVVVVAGIHFAAESTALTSAGERKCLGHRVDALDVLRRPAERPLPRAVPAAAPARLGRHGPRVARARRAQRVSTSRLKIVSREGKGGQRAEREARAAAALRHERCQRILALARDANHVYIAYEYVPGPHAARGAPRRRARRLRRDRGWRRRSPTRSRTRTAAASSTAT